MKHWLIIILIMCSASGWCQDAFAKADSLYSNGNPKAAQALYKTLLNKDPKNITTIRRLGDIELDAGKYKMAASYYKQLVDIDPLDAEYHFLYGGTIGLYAKGASPFKAISYIDDIKYHLNKAAQLDPQHIEVRWALVQFYCELPAIIGGSISTSRKYADQLLEIVPARGHIAMGYIAEYQKQYNTAVQCYQKAIATNQSIEAYRKLALLYEFKKQDYHKALQTLEQANRLYKLAHIQSDIARVKEKMS